MQALNVPHTPSVQPLQRSKVLTGVGLNMEVRLEARFTGSLGSSAWSFVIFILSVYFAFRLRSISQPWKCRQSTARAGIPGNWANFCHPPPKPVRTFRGCGLVCRDLHSLRRLVYGWRWHELCHPTECFMPILWIPHSGCPLNTISEWFVVINFRFMSIQSFFSIWSCITFWIWTHQNWTSWKQHAVPYYIFFMCAGCSCYCDFFAKETCMLLALDSSKPVWVAASITLELEVTFPCAAKKCVAKRWLRISGFGNGVSCYKTNDLIISRMRQF